MVTYEATERKKMHPRVLAKVGEHASHANMALLTSRRWLRDVQTQHA